MPRRRRSEPSKAMTDAQPDIHGRLWERFHELREEHAGVLDHLLEELGLSYLREAEDPLRVRLGDLAVAVHRAEHVTADRVELPTGVTLVRPDDAVRNPGFAGVEEEWWHEELRLVELRTRLAGR